MTIDSNPDILKDYTVDSVSCMNDLLLQYHIKSAYDVLNRLTISSQHFFNRLRDFDQTVRSDPEALYVARFALDESEYIFRIDKDNVSQVSLNLIEHLKELAALGYKLEEAREYVKNAIELEEIQHNGGKFGDQVICVIVPDKMDGRVLYWPGVCEFFPGENNPLIPVPYFDIPPSAPFDNFETAVSEYADVGDLSNYLFYAKNAELFPLVEASTIAIFDKLKDMFIEKRVD